MSRARAEGLLAGADAVLNVAGATRFAEEGLEVGRLIYIGTDPVFHEVALDRGDEGVRSLLEEHDDVVTAGENIGTSESPVPPTPKLRARTRQPILLDLWESGPPPRSHFTTVGNWRQLGVEFDYRGDRYRWSKHHEFLKVIDLPRRVTRPLELAMNLDEREGEPEPTESIPAMGLDSPSRSLLKENGWGLVDACALTEDPWPYREYIRSSSGEFTVARDLHVRLRSGWFSERSACYLAAGRPVITQDTGFGTVLPTGEGLFAYRTPEEAVAAFEAIESDYPRHARAARAIAEEYFDSAKVLPKVIADVGI